MQFMRWGSMIASLKHRFVLLSMPKCASEALERALGPRADVVFRDPPTIKHCNYRRYARFVQPFFERFGDGTPETLCLFREPVDWLNSWWRYRQRPFLDGKPNSTKGQSFDRFVQLYLDAEGPPATIGRQSRFVIDRDQEVGVDQLFRYENLPRLTSWIETRTGWDVTLERVNTSPKVPGGSDLAPVTIARMRAELARDFEIYDQIT
ncbi:MAG: gamma-glutamyl kinase [Pseudomonadota bacterium]